MTEIYEEMNVHSPPGTEGEASQSERPRESAGEFTEEARRKGKGFFEEQKSTAARSLGSIASALQETCSRLESEQPSTARLLGQGAEAMERIAENLQRKDADALLHQFEDLARRQPALMLGGAVAAGFLLTRMLKSTPHRSESEYGSRKPLFESAKETVRSGFEGERKEEESGGIILSPDEPMEDVARDPSTGEELPRRSFISPEEEHHAND